MVYVIAFYMCCCIFVVSSNVWKENGAIYVSGEHKKSLTHIKAAGCGAFMGIIHRFSGGNY